MAEAIARSAIEVEGWEGLEVASAGVSAGTGAPASGGAIRAAQAHGLDLSGHRSRQLTPALIAWADLILTMSWRHSEMAVAAGGDGKTAMLTSYAAGAGRLADDGVPDPFGGSDAEYEATFRALQDLVLRALARLGGAPRP